MQQCEVIQRGQGISGKNRYRATFTSYPTVDMLVKAQVTAGFNPCGYGGPDDVQVTQSGERFHAEWTSQATCD